MEDIVKELAEVSSRSKSNTHQISELKGRIDKYDAKIERLQEQNISITKLSTLFEELREDIRNQAEYNKSMSNTLSDIEKSISNTNAKIQDLTRAQERSNVKLNDMDERIEYVDGKSKLDIIPIIMKNVVPFILGGGIIYYIMTVINNM